ncbi:hypothetical protein [Desulfurispira natronophila]|uniref:Uncharacterized protein n=1 Tax=Desulfurispira natronophila TaxID=682562 RepID=A0A7W7Y439_9BACT|nr:hypothetical protein [Desulfurispira natronophila]MBB5021579.1 hypothetical protein [Desulfurispira natronophila]
MSSAEPQRPILQRIMESIHQNYQQSPQEPRQEIAALLAAPPWSAPHHRVLLLVGYLEILSIIHFQQLGIPLTAIIKLKRDMEFSLDGLEVTLDDLCKSDVLNAAQPDSDTGVRETIYTVTEKGYEVIEEPLTQANYRVNYQYLAKRSAP